MFEYKYSLNLQACLLMIASEFHTQTQACIMQAFGGRNGNVLTFVLKSVGEDQAEELACRQLGPMFFLTGSGMVEASYIRGPKDIAQMRLNVAEMTPELYDEVKSLSNKLCARYRQLLDECKKQLESAPAEEDHPKDLFISKITRVIPDREDCHIVHLENGCVVKVLGHHTDLKVGNYVHSHPNDGIEIIEQHQIN